MNKFKRVGLLMVGMAVMALASLKAEAATFAGTGTDIGATNCYFIASANYPGVPRINYLNATSDKAASVVTFWTPGAPVKITATGASGQAVVTAVGTGNFAANDRVVVRHLTADTYQMMTVSSVTSTNVTMVQNLDAAVASGDLIYKMTANGTIAVGNATKEINAAGGGIYNGREGRPLLLDLDGTAACQINVASGVYEK